MDSSKLDTSKLALCNVCSRLEKCVQVLCEGRCLICLRCEHSPPIQRLLFSIVNKNKTDSWGATNEDNAQSPVARRYHNGEKEFLQCPLCDNALASSMLVVIRASYTKMNLYKPNSKPGNFMADSASIFHPAENIIAQFVRRFRISYPDLFESPQSREFAPPSQISGNFSSAVPQQVVQGGGISSSRPVVQVGNGDISSSNGGLGSCFATLFE